MFMPEEDYTKFAGLFCNEIIEWLSIAYYIEDSFGGKTPKTFNLFPQDKEDILTINEKVVAFERNVPYGKNILKTLPLLYDLIVKKYTIMFVFCLHTNLVPEFFHLFKFFQRVSWLFNLFIKIIKMQHLLISVQEQLTGEMEIY